MEVLSNLDDDSIDLILTSPPYNIGKEYEDKQNLDQYLNWQETIIRECIRVLKPTGNLCWQVGNYIDKSNDKSEIIPLDCVLYPTFKKYGCQLRNRIVWSFEHGLHCKNRFSGRHETIMWFTKTENYTFNLDDVRVKQKYPNKKHYKGPNKGKISGNPLGANPGDVWNIPNVKHNHVEKTNHPCQFPVELVGTLILSLTNKNDLVLDPFAGSCSTGIASMIHERNSICCELDHHYVQEGKIRYANFKDNNLKIRSERWMGNHEK